MSIITVKLHRITPMTDLSLIESLGYIKTIQHASDKRLPDAGIYAVDGREYDYLMPDGTILYDWVMLDGLNLGYCLELPYPCPPCKADPSKQLAKSALQRAVDYYRANPGCSQSAAARAGGCSPSNLNTRLKQLLLQGR